MIDSSTREAGGRTGACTFAHLWRGHSRLAIIILDSLIYSMFFSCESFSVELAAEKNMLLEHIL